MPPSRPPALPLAVAARASARVAWQSLSNRTEPPRYAEDFLEPFGSAIAPTLTLPGARILDLGSGRSPTIPSADRAPGTRYVGLDLSAEELERAPAGSYDDYVVADASTWVSELEGQFDLVVSLYVLEHISDLDKALDIIRGYLVPGGRFVALFSGRNSAFGLVNRVLPERISAPFVAKLMRRDASAVFPAHYDRCTQRELEALLARWGGHELTTSWRGLNYFRFSRVLSAAYLGYEEFALRRAMLQLAPYYLINATR